MRPVKIMCKYDYLIVFSNVSPKKGLFPCKKRKKLVLLQIEKQINMDKFGCVIWSFVGIIILFALGSDSTSIWWIITIVSVITLFIILFTIFYGKEPPIPNDKESKNNHSKPYSSQSYPNPIHRMTDTSSYCPPSSTGIPHLEDFDENGFAYKNTYKDSSDQPVSQFDNYKKHEEKAPDSYYSESKDNHSTPYSPQSNPNPQSTTSASSYCPPCPIGVPYLEDFDENGFAYKITYNDTSNQIVSQFDNYNKHDDYDDNPMQTEDILTMADTILHYCLSLENDASFRCELAKHNIEFNDINGDPLLGYGADVRRLFFIDIAHCFSEMNDYINLEDSDNVGVLYLLCLLYRPDLGLDHSNEHLEIVREESSDIMTRFVQAIANAPIFKEDDEADFMVALVLLQYDPDEFRHYLMLLYRFCTLVAKADGHISSKEQAFLHHISHLLDTVGNSYRNVKTEQVSEKRGSINELNNLIGLENVKQEVQTIYNFAKVQLSRQEQGLRNTPVSYHCVFIGNPGTGKTTVARIIASIYAELGVLENGQLVETDRSGLVAEYEGQTAVKTNKVIDRAIGGVLFIDEAYALVNGDQTDFGREAIATLIKRMEDDRDHLVVILAGYKEEMKQFIDSNPGLQSRFNRYIYFPDYSAKELHQIFCSLIKKYDYYLTEDASSTILKRLTDAVNNKGNNFGNGRLVRNLFEKTIERQANRLTSYTNPTLKQLKEITVEDCL